MNYCFVVNWIFVVYLSGECYGFVFDNMFDMLELEVLCVVFVMFDCWYFDYVVIVIFDMLLELIFFLFIDGDNGYMMCEEMLIYVVMYGGYYCGEVGRLMV